MDVYAVSGLYYYCENFFELDTIETKVFKNVDEANKYAGYEFKSIAGEWYIDYLKGTASDTDYNERYDENGCMSLEIYNTDNGERIFVNVIKQSI